MMRTLRRGLSAFLAVWMLFSCMGIAISEGEPAPTSTQAITLQSDITEEPKADPTTALTEEPTAAPTAEPTAEPTEAPSEEPTAAPTPTESSETVEPTVSTESPTTDETPAPSVSPETPQPSVTITPEPSPTLEGELLEGELPTQAPFTQGLVTLPAQTVLFTDQALVDPLGTLQEDGVAYATLLDDSQTAAVRFTRDGLTVEQAYIPVGEGLLPLSEEQLAAYAANENGLPDGDILLFPLTFVPVLSYEQQTYGLPGIADGYELTAAEIAAKQELAGSELMGQLDTMQAGVDYVSDELLVYAASQAEAEMIAQSYGATVRSYQDGLAVLALSGVSPIQAVHAAADPLTRLVAAYLNHYYYFEDPITDGGNTSSTSTFSLTARDVPTLQTWSDFQSGDPFLAAIDSKGHFRVNASITDGYQYMHDLVGAYGAWGLTKGDGATVFVIDSGANSSHIDLQGQVSAASSDIADTVGHGTHVAGIIAAIQGNHTGGAGIAPEAHVLMYKCTSGSSVLTASVRAGLRAALTSDACVVSMSLGGRTFDAITNAAVQECISAGIPVVAATGNTGSRTLYYPAQYSGVISVAATDPTGRRAPYSTYGAATLSAPGSYILSTSIRTSNGFESKNGTSMATPVVSGIVALYYSAMGDRDLNGDGQVNASDVSYLTTKLKAACTPVTGSSSGMGAGILNATHLLSDMLSRPTITLADDATGTPFSGKTSAVPSTAYVQIKGSGNGDYLLYTLDGTKPAVKDGEVVNGIAANGTALVSLADLPAGTVTVRAMSVSAQGENSRVTSYSFTINNLVARAVTVSGTRFVGVGKSATYTATILPVTKTLKPTWSIVSSPNPKDSIGKSSGKLTIHKTSTPGSAVTIRATVGTGEAAISGDMTVTVQSPVKSVLIYDERDPLVHVCGKKISLAVGATVRITPTALLTNGDALVGADTLDYKVSLTNTKRASVALDGDAFAVTGLAPGNTELYVRSLDGSGKYTHVTLVVRQPVLDVSITNAENGILAYGTSLALKAVISPSNATNKRVSWHLVGNVPQGVKLSSGGKLTIPKDQALVGQSVTVRCVALDNPTLQNEQVITITVPVSAISLTTDDPKATFNRKGVLTGGRLYTLAISNTLYDASEENAENTMQLSASVNDAAAQTLRVRWTSSNEKIATVDQTGLVTAVSKGYATIRCKALDGTGRSASVRLRVVCPVSTITLSPATRKSSISSYATLAYGKTLKFSTAYGTEYGNPTLRSVTWSFELRSYPRAGYLYDMDNTQFFDLVTDATMRSYIQLSNGSLRVSSRLYNLYPISNADYFVKVTATATDGTGKSGSYFVLLTPPATFLRAMSGTFPVYDADGEPIGGSTTLTTTTQLVAGNSASTYCYFASDFYAPEVYANLYDFTLTTGKVRVASAYSLERVRISSINYYVKLSGKLYPLYRVGVKGDSAGKTNLTVRVNDGTGKSCVFTLQVR